ncbi:phosphoribosyl-ATP diphosphatase [Alphaproteobacteria bacterium]|jgi:phosphoribosyl-ATP pyrophosphohydrolase|nr:phosphoribosyl-ATP diphosphatase [Alphaproteobacteria bacterium]
MAEDILSQLYERILDRKDASSDESYSARLLAGGPVLAGRKLSEEATETLIAAIQETPEALTKEAADLLYHLLVLLVSRGVTLDSVFAELRSREAQSGLAEKASRSS